MQKKILALLVASLTTSFSGASFASQDISTCIYNGTTTSSTAWPSIATLFYDAITYNGVYGQYCGATILDEQHVLTAAHCLYENGNLNEDYMTFTTIALQMTSDNQFTAGAVETVRAEEFYVHPDYIDSATSSSVPWPNDIAVIKLADTINVSATDYVTRAVPSEATSYRIDNESFIAVGYGRTENGGAGDLLETDLNYEPAASCDLRVGDSQICTKGAYDSSTAVRNSTCSGDSGGPLYWHNGTQFVQVGITSYGWGDCYVSYSDATSAFTEVADYQVWIDSVVAGSEVPVFSVRAEDRDAAIPEGPSKPENDDTETDDKDEKTDFATSRAGGGSTSFPLVGFLALIGLFRRKHK